MHLVVYPFSLTLLLGLFTSLSSSLLLAAPEKPLSPCEKYALEAVSQSESNRDAKCQLTGALWNTSYLAQVKWCNGVKPEQAEKANADRASAITQCLAKRAMQGGVALPKDAQSNSLLVSFMINRYLRPVTEWYMGMEQVLLPQGRKLTQEEIQLAEQMGVRQAYRIRIIKTDTMPMPEDLLGSMASLFKAQATNETGRAMGYALLMRPQYANNKALLTHLFGYVAQIEKVGHKAFLERYATEILTMGYKDSTMVKEAATLLQ